MADLKEKLVIIRGQFQGSDAVFSSWDSDNVFTVRFNPTEYTIGKKTDYAEAAIPGLDSPIMQFSKGEARTLSIELLLDTYTYDNCGDVRSLYLQKLQSFLMVDGSLHAPPPCKIVWGSMEFVGLMDNLSKRYVMFLDDGTPVRARVTLSFKEFIPVNAQLYATPRESPDRRKIHILKRGESLWQLAHRAYGDPRRWRVIAEHNSMDNPRKIVPGNQLVIPALEPPAGMFDDAN